MTLRASSSKKTAGAPVRAGAAAKAKGNAKAKANATVLDRSFYEDDSRKVARRLLNKLLIGRGRVARIVEVEAYLGEMDPASHAFRGLTKRNATMFGPGGHLYVYFTYGMHFCANVVCGPEGVGRAVLLRAVAPVSGTELMRAARTPGVADRDLGSGPGKLCQAMGIDLEDDGADLVTGDRDLVLAEDGTPPPRRPGVSGRVGLTVAADRPWRWWVDGDPNVSRAPRRPAVRRP
jgi:DNA-3-methyladenine glycosylase